MFALLGTFNYKPGDVHGVLCMLWQVFGRRLLRPAFPPFQLLFVSGQLEMYLRPHISYVVRFRGEKSLTSDFSRESNSHLQLQDH